MAPTVPTVMVNEHGASRIRAGNPWVYAPDLLRVPPSGEGDVVRVADAASRLLGTALYAEGAQLPLRMLGRGELVLDGALLESRLRAALARREAMFAGADAYRVAHGESDGLPGLFVDRYGDVAVIQTLARAMDAREPEIAAIVMRVLSARLVVARDDGSARDFEGLPRRKGVLAGSGPTTIAYHDSGNRFEADALEDGKTGGFLDQRENHARASELARGHCLDAFSYHGGFALALARGGAASVLALDESGPAVARIRENAARNRLAQVVAEQVNAFDRLRALEAGGRRFDVVVLDPPAFAKRKSALRGAERAYRELNLRGFRLLAPGALLITCSCSGKVTPAHFGELVEAASRDAGRAAQLLERRGAGRDHPPLLGVPETDYLKCWFVRAVD
jgi:23S rRNA (cytosine1962-C5)-methyltransferase